MAHTQEIVQPCEICDTKKNLVRHHICYEPEIIQILCRRCHKLEHWKNNNNCVRPLKFKSQLYDDVVYYQPFYHQRRNILVKEDDAKHYKIRKTGKQNKSLETTIPKEFFKKELERLTIPFETDIRNILAMWKYGNFSGLYLTFELRENKK